jgi:hypothetical protein
VLRQLAALTQRVPAAGSRALAVAVYSGSTGERLEARESGVEGVACVDDAARACTLLFRLWAATGNNALKRWAEGLLDFLLWMHSDAGRWHNFIYDWQGARNTDGPTSDAGINFCRRGRPAPSRRPKYLLASVARNRSWWPRFPPLPPHLRPQMCEPSMRWVR